MGDRVEGVVARSARIKNTDTRMCGFQEHGWTRMGDWVACVMAKVRDSKTRTHIVCFSTRMGTDWLKPPMNANDCWLTPHAETQRLNERRWRLGFWDTRAACFSAQLGDSAFQ